MSRIGELFVEPPDAVRHWPGAPHQKFPWTALFAGVDKVLRWSEPFFPETLRRRAIGKAAAFVEERLNGEDGLGAIFPAMTYSALMFDALGYHRQDRRMVQVLKAIDKLLVVRDDEAYCQPCVSPVWDTGACLPRPDGSWRGNHGAACSRRACLARTSASHRCRGRLGRAKTPCPAGRLAVPICQRLLSRCRRYRCRGDGDGPRGGEWGGVQGRGRSRARMDRRPAKRRWRLGRLRCPTTTGSI